MKKNLKILLKLFSVTLMLLLTLNGCSTNDDSDTPLEQNEQQNVATQHQASGHINNTEISVENINLEIVPVDFSGLYTVPTLYKNNAYLTVYNNLGENAGQENMYNQERFNVVYSMDKKSTEEAAIEFLQLNSNADKTYYTASESGDLLWDFFVGEVIYEVDPETGQQTEIYRLHPEQQVVISQDISFNNDYIVWYENEFDGTELKNITIKYMNLKTKEIKIAEQELNYIQMNRPFALYENKLVYVNSEQKAPRDQEFGTQTDCYIAMFNLETGQQEFKLETPSAPYYVDYNGNYFVWNDRQQVKVYDVAKNEFVIITDILDLAVNIPRFIDGDKFIYAELQSSGENLYNAINIFDISENKVVFTTSDEQIAAKFGFDVTQTNFRFVKPHLDQNAVTFIYSKGTPSEEVGFAVLTF